MVVFDKIKEIVANVEADVEKFDGGNKAAGTRVRKAFMEIKTLALEGRKAVTEQKNAS